MTGLDITAAGFGLHVTPHAQWRAAERFSICFTEDIEADIHKAFRDGNVSGQHHGVIKGIASDSLYCVVDDERGKRVYVIEVDRKAGHTNFAVITVIAARDA